MYFLLKGVNQLLDMGSVDAICFDLDETLCDSELSDHEFNNRVFQRAGIDPIFSPWELRAIDPEDIERENKRRSSNGDSIKGIAGFYTNLYRATVRSIGTDIEAESSLIEELGKIAGELYDPTAVTFREGAEETLKYAREHYKVGLITNGKKETQMAKLEELGITDAFDTVVICDPTKGISGKPASEPFETALADLSTSAKNTIHVGNSHGEDILGAHNAGFQTVWVPMNRAHEELSSEPDPAPTYRVEMLGELRSIL